jgi:hypothetical protein
MEYFNGTQIGKTERLFSTFYDTTTPKILAMGLSSFSILIVTPILFSIIWFEFFCLYSWIFKIILVRKFLSENNLALER